MGYFLRNRILCVLPKQDRFSTGRTIQRIAELLRGQYCLKFSEEELEEALDYLIRIGKLVRIYTDNNFYYYQPFKNR